MKKALILAGVLFALCLAAAFAQTRPKEAANDSDARLTCQLCFGKSCPQSSSGVCNCTVFYRCPNDNCSLTVCNSCYYKYVLPNLNKGCPGCKGHKQFKQVH